MARYEVRPLCSDDYPTVMKLEEEVFGAAGEAVLGPYYVKLCCEFFAQSCLLALVSGEPDRFAHRPRGPGSRARAPREAGPGGARIAGGRGMTDAALRLARIVARVARTGICAFDGAGRIRLLRRHGTLDAPAQARVLQRLAQEVLEVHGVRAEVSGPVPDRPVLLVANHVSWLDPLVIMANAPCLPVAKSEVESCLVRLQFGEALQPAPSLSDLELSRRAHLAMAAGLREVRDGAAVGA